MDKNTKLTLEMLMARAQQAKDAKKKYKTAEVYVESLDANITLREPTRGHITDAQNISDTPALQDRYMLYQMVVEPDLHNAELRAAYGCAAPDEIVDMVFKPGEVSAIVKIGMRMAGFGNRIEEIKNS